MRTFAAKPLDVIVTVADAKHLLRELDRAHEAQEQLAFADVVLLNKTDLVSEEELTAIEARIHGFNPGARIHRTQRCDVNLGEVLGRDAFSLDRILEIEPEFLDDLLEHEHDDHITSLSLTTGEAIDPEKFFPWIQDTVQRLGTDILRMKGILALKGDDDRYVIQSVHMLMEGGHQRPWRHDEKRDSRLVFIGRDLPKEIFDQGFRACKA